VSIPPRARRRAAATFLALSVVVGWPLSWWLPTLDDVWFMRLVTWLSFLALTFTLADVWATSDVRTNQNDEVDPAGPTP
jgi:hypothetical protein